VLIVGYRRCVLNIEDIKPVIRVNLRPSDPGDLDLLFFSIRTAMADDPNLAVDYREDCAILKGMGELHLEVAARRIAGFFGKPNGVEVGDTSIIFFEPIMHVAVMVPDCFIHQVCGEVQRRGSKRPYVEQHGGTTTVTANIPLMKLKGLMGSLREVTEGHARSVLTPCGHKEIGHKELLEYLVDYPSE